MWSRGRGGRAELFGNQVPYVALCLVELVKARFVGLSKDINLLVRVCCWECQRSSLTTHFKLKDDQKGRDSLFKGQIKYESMCMSWSFHDIVRKKMLTSLFNVGNSAQLLCSSLGG